MTDRPRETLFRSERLHAAFVPAAAGGESRPLVVTFDSLNHDLSLERPGFGEIWLWMAGYDAVHVVSSQNAWYQHGELPQLLAQVKARSLGRCATVTYGSSMGGYAAVRFAEAVGAQRAIAISPQFSVDPGRNRFDSRWAHHGRGIRFVWPESEPSRGELEDAFVFFDPRDYDQLHTEALAALYPVRPIPIPHAGHPAGGYLAESGLLGPVVIDMIEGRFDAAAFEPQVRSARRRSGQYLFTLAHRQPTRRLRTAVRLAGGAVSGHPDSAPYQNLYGRLLEQAGEVASAEAALRCACALEPGYPGFRVDLAAFLTRQGRGAEAAAYVRGLDAYAVEQPTLFLTACRVLLLAGEDREARRLAHVGRRRFPDEPRFIAWARALDVLVAAPLLRRPLLRLAWRRVQMHPPMATRGPPDTRRVGPRLYD